MGNEQGLPRRYEERRTLAIVGTLGGSGMLVAHAQYGHIDIEKEMHDIRTCVNVEFSLIKGELTKLHEQSEITHTLVLTSALKTIKGLDGDKVEMREFARRMEKLFKCKEASGGDFGSLKNVNN
ncbi:hypothetical protein HOY82DRAFT_645653 [Tuber indicum]|nr:hypothetical protein HOY82DRAFT_645653 [Tuber indicum]